MKYFLIPFILFGVWFFSQRLAPLIPKDRAAVQAPAVRLLSLLEGTNNERTQQGLGALTEDAILDTAALTKCNDMETRNYWAHSINGEAFYQFDPPASKTGENLAKGFGSDQAVINGWMNSKEHRDNLLDPTFTRVGFAHCEGPQTHLVVQELES